MTNKHLIQTDRYLVLSRIFPLKRESREKNARHIFGFTLFVRSRLDSSFFPSPQRYVHDQRFLSSPFIVECHSPIPLMTFDIICEKTRDTSRYILARKVKKNGRIARTLAFSATNIFFPQSMLA